MEKIPSVFWRAKKISPVLVLAAAIGLPSIAVAEYPEIRDLVNSNNAADRWHGEQLRRAQEFRRNGEREKAHDVEKYAEKRTERVKVISGGLGEDLWSGPRHSSIP